MYYFIANIINTQIYFCSIYLQITYDCPLYNLLIRLDNKLPFSYYCRIKKKSYYSNSKEAIDELNGKSIRFEVCGFN